MDVHKAHTKETNRNTREKAGGESELEGTRTVTDNCLDGDGKWCQRSWEEIWGHREQTMV
jgi:hypothetical protein